MPTELPNIIKSIIAANHQLCGFPTALRSQLEEKILTDLARRRMSADGLSAVQFVYSERVRDGVVITMKQQSEDDRDRFDAYFADIENATYPKKVSAKRGAGHWMYMKDVEARLSAANSEDLADYFGIRAIPMASVVEHVKFPLAKS
ncbi:MAG: hypothetical protein ACOYNL_04650 [Rickettsiales bacterium]